MSYVLFQRLEKAYKSYRIRIKKPLVEKQIQHIIFSICTFVIFNIYFLFGGRPIIQLFPEIVELAFNVLGILVSILWLYKTLEYYQVLTEEKACKFIKDCCKSY